MLVSLIYYCQKFIYSTVIFKKTGLGLIHHFYVFPVFSLISDFIFTISVPDLFELVSNSLLFKSKILKQGCLGSSVG